jgi:hypothetical protein
LLGVIFACQQVIFVWDPIGLVPFPTDIIPPPLALMLGVLAIEVERKEKTFALHFTRPIRRETLLFLKFTALALLLLGAMVVGAVLGGIRAWGCHYLFGRAWGWHPLFGVSELQDWLFNFVVPDIIYMWIVNVFALITGLFVGLWVSSAVGKVRPVLFALASVPVALATIFVIATSLYRLDPTPIQLVMTAIFSGVILVGANLGFIRQIQVRE